MEQSRTSTFLRRVLLADAATCAAAGLLMWLRANQLEQSLGLPAALSRYAGISLLPVAAYLVYLARRERLSRSAVLIVIGLNALWAVDSILLVLSGWLELTGSEGTIILEYDRIVAAELRNAKIDLVAPSAESANASATSPVVADVSGHKELLKDFLRAIDSNGTPICDGVEGRRSVELVEAIYESARTGNPVTLRT